MQDYGLSLVTGPASEPLTVAEGRAQIRQAPGDEEYDTLITRWIKEAREYAEGATGRKFGNQTWKMTLDEWPCEDIRLPVGTSSITHIKYLDADGEEQTLDADAYALRTDKTPALLYPAWNESWPLVRGDPGCIRITFVCGETAPHCVTAAMAILVGWRDKNREGDISAGVTPRVSDLLAMASTGLLYGVA